MEHENRQALIDHLAQFISDRKKKRICRVLENRTRYVCLVLEDIYKAQNASATLRTCDGLGVQDVHVIERRSPLSLDRDVHLGSAKWVTLHRYRDKTADNTAACYRRLRRSGYRIVATTPGRKSAGLETLSLEHPIAFVFGNEEMGLSPEAVNSADACVRLPMWGFTQSYNITVSVAVTLFQVLQRLRTSGIDMCLSDDEKQELTLAWYSTSVRGSAAIVKKFAADSESGGSKA